MCQLTGMPKVNLDRLCVFWENGSFMRGYSHRNCYQYARIVHTCACRANTNTHVHTHIHIYKYAYMDIYITAVGLLPV